MLALDRNEVILYGCPNCGCETHKLTGAYLSNQPHVVCSACDLVYQILPNGTTESNLEIDISVRDIDGKRPHEKPTFISHPRKGLKCWKLSDRYSLPSIIM